MRISANLLLGRTPLALPLAALLWSLAAVLVLVAVVLMVAALDMRAERPRLEQRLARVDEQLQAAAPRNGLPPAAELAALRQRVTALNAYASARGASTVRILGWLEGHLPDNVYLVSLHHKPREGDLLLVAAAPSAEAFTAFLRIIEKEPWFSEVLLSKQAVRGHDGGGGLQFELRVRPKS